MSSHGICRSLGVSLRKVEHVLFSQNKWNTQKLKMTVAYPADDVERAHEDLVQMSVFHQVSLLPEGVLESRPDLPLAVVADLQG